MQNAGGFPGGSVVKNLPPNAGDSSLIPDSGRSHRPQNNSVHWAQLLSLGSETIELRCCNYWSLVPLSLCFTTKEVTEIRSLHNAIKSSPCSLQLDKSLWSNKDAAQPKIRKYKKKVSIKNILPYNYFPSTYLLWWTVQIFDLFKIKGAAYFLTIEFSGFFCILYTSPLSGIWFAEIFPSVHGLFS